MRFKVGLGAFLSLLLALFYFAGSKNLASENCLFVESELQLCALSDMAKLSDGQLPDFEHTDYSLKNSLLSLNAARNETIGVQFLLFGGERVGLSVELTDFRQSGERVEVQPHREQFLAHYHQVDRGAYSWGPTSKVLPWPASYPDALVPQSHSCSGKQLYNSLPDAAAQGKSSLIWQDIYIPKNMPQGNYSAELKLTRDGKLLRKLDVDLQVWSARLPDENSIDAVGELYRTYRMEGIGENPESPGWHSMSNCYQQLAHAHRSTFLERNPTLPGTEEQWANYQKHYGAMLDGSLFSEARGYIGPGAETAVSVWRTPWPQPYDMKLEGPLNYGEIRHYEALAKKWHQISERNGWQRSRWFAYVFDEVDGPEHTDENYLAMAHHQMGLVQEAIDAGTEDKSIDLLWTSHSDPSIWTKKPALDLRDKVRLWAPNAHAASPAFMEQRAQKGDRNWFYHSGHPAVGVHSINASGIELRSWGAIAARYNVDGILMWAVNLGNDEKPFADPSYKPDDDRFGNGVLVYPGHQLPRIGFPAAAGAIPSVRLKSWRRGLQDYELVQLAAAHDPQRTAELLKAIVPRALGDGQGDPAWPSDPASWINFRLELLKLASR